MDGMDKKWTKWTGVRREIREFHSFLYRACPFSPFSSTWSISFGASSVSIKRKQNDSFWIFAHLRNKNLIHFFAIVGFLINVFFVQLVLLEPLRAHVLFLLE